MTQMEQFRDFVQTLYRRLGFLQRDQICCAGVTVPQCYALQILHREGELTSGELADRLGLDPSSATRAVDVLVRRKLVERVRPDDAGDRRRVHLRLTTAGIALTEQLVVAGDHFFGSVLAQFSATERRDLIKLLGKLSSVLGATVGCCDPFALSDQNQSRGKTAKGATS